MSSEEQQLNDTTPEAVVAEMDIDQALLIYKNMQINVSVLIEDFISPTNKNGKRKTEKQKHLDLRQLANTFKLATGDLQYNEDSFKRDGKFPYPKALDLYKQLMAIQKAKEVIKNDLRDKVTSGEVTLTEEQKQKLLKEL